MALSAVNWMLDMRHRGEDGKGGLGEYHDGTFESWSHTRSAAHPHHFRDGTSYWVSKYDLTPEADWL